MKNIDSASGNQQPKAPLSYPFPAPVPAASINLLKTKGKPSGRKVLKRIILLIVLVIVVLGGVVAIRAANLEQKIFVGQKITFFGRIAQLIGVGGGTKLIGMDVGQVNILLLGVGGAGHDGPYLTDTMILAQIRPDIDEITLTSIPRDYLATLPDGSQEKINSAFAYGLGNNNNLDWNVGGTWARDVVQNLTGLQVPYFAVMDFSGFEKAIDQVGGVDITVDRTFTDYQYPDNGTGYLPPQTFTAGPQHMDGATALIFARSPPRGRSRRRRFCPQPAPAKNH